MSTPVAELRGVTRRFSGPEGPLRVLEQLDLSIFPGDRIVLFGPSGCGKTTLLHLLALLDRPDAGRHRFAGREVADWDENRRADARAREIGLVFQHFHLLSWHRVRENLLLRQRYLRGAEPPPPHRAEELLAAVGLGGRADQPARLLSGGEKQRLCIARALLCRPALLLADEPTGNLDADHSRRIRELFHQMADQCPVVVATHDPDWFEFANRVLRFEQGRLREDRA